MPVYTWDNISKLFGIIVVILILVLGIVVATSQYFEYIPKNYRLIFSFFIIAYAAFRLVTIYNKPKYNKNE